MPTERPILFSGEMVKAILAGRKTQTRREVKGVGNDNCLKVGKQLVHVTDPNAPCPYGKPGDLLWVRETHLIVGGKDSPNPRVVYRATNDGPDEWVSAVWKPSIHMPRWASRLTLRITDVRVERLQDISEQDAIAEGRSLTKGDPRGYFPETWEKINGRGSWSQNPWVWAVSFEVVK